MRGEENRSNKRILGRQFTIGMVNTLSITPVFWEFIRMLWFKFFLTSQIPQRRKPLKYISSRFLRDVKNVCRIKPINDFCVFILTWRAIPPLSYTKTKSRGELLTELNRRFRIWRGNGHGEWTLETNGYQLRVFVYITVPPRVDGPRRTETRKKGKMAASKGTPLRALSRPRDNNNTTLPRLPSTVIGFRTGARSRRGLLETCQTLWERSSLYYYYYYQSWRIIIYVAPGGFVTIAVFMLASNNYRAVG